MASVNASAPPALTRSATWRVVGFEGPRSKRSGAISMSNSMFRRLFARGYQTAWPKNRTPSYGRPLRLPAPVGQQVIEHLVERNSRSPSSRLGQTGGVPDDDRHVVRPHSGL